MTDPAGPPFELSAVWRVLGRPTRQVAGCLANSCFLAGGCYIDLGSLGGVGGCRDLLRCGAARWQLMLFGLAAIFGGLYVWHRMGPLSSWFTAKDTSRDEDLKSEI